MATIASRISANGTLLLNGNFDEVTFNNTSPVIKNTLSYSNAFNNGSGWQQVASTAIANSTTAPDGTNTAFFLRESATSNNGHYVQATPTWQQGYRYTYSIYAKAGTRTKIFLLVGANAIPSQQNATFDLITGVISGINTTNGTTAAIVNVGDGWWRCSITTPAAISTGTSSIWASVNNGTTINYTGDGVSGLYIWGAQVEQGTVATVYQGIGATNTLVTPTFKTKTAVDSIYSTGVYDEVTYSSTAPAIKNLLNYTEDFTQWSKNASPNDYTVVANSTTAPNNTLTADLIVKGTTAGTSSICYKLFSGAINTAYCGSIYVKAGGYSKVQIVFGSSSFNNVNIGGTINLLTGAVNSSLSGSTVTVTNAGNGWYRVSVTATSSGTVGNYVFSLTPLDDSYLANFAGNGTSGIYAWGAQVELGSIASIYQGIAATNVLLTPGFAKREDASGNLYVIKEFDEFTGAPVVDSSLVLWLDAGQATSYSGVGTTVVDLSTATNNGTVVGTLPFNSRDSGGSFSFNGGDNYIGGFTTPLVRTGSRTIESWFQISTNSVRMGLAGDRDGTGWIFCVNRNGNGSLSYNHAGTASDLNVAANVPINTWINAVATYDVASATVNIYMNGNLLGTGTSYAPIVPATTPVSYVGWETNSLKFQGKIAATKIYNRALTADEVQQNFNALRRRYGI